MKLKAISLLIGALVLNCASAGEAPGTSATLIDHQKVEATFAKGGTLMDSGNFKIQAGRRSAPGEVEIHEHDTDIFHVLEGSATIVTGGTVTGLRTNAPGEFRGKAITGGETRHLEKGDVLVIPSGVPHWFTEASGPFLYFVVKVTK